MSTSHSPVVIATMCHCSGPTASAGLPIVDGARVWVRYINANGGLHGHQVRHIVYDDGTDPARHRAQVQDAIEGQHAIAFIVETSPFAAKSTVGYITAKRVPVIGSGLSDPWDYESPMYFPQASAARPAAYGALAGAAQALVPAGRTKLALMPCAESDVCRATTSWWSQFSKALGFQVVYEAQVSIAQPDYTAVCLSARNAGAQVLAAVLDPNSIHRLAASCARQAYFPAFTHLPGAVDDNYKGDANIRSYAFGSNVFPYFQSSTAAARQYRDALDAYGGGKVRATVGSAMGWVAGKLLERAGAALSEPPTSQSLLSGLWSIKNDDLGGLTAPLTFTENQPTKATSACWFTIVLQNGAWSSPDGYQRHCRDVP